MLNSQHFKPTAVRKMSHHIPLNRMRIQYFIRDIIRAGVTVLDR